LYNPRVRNGLTLAIAVTTLVVLAAACSRTTDPAAAPQQAARAPTFHRDIAPILFDNCASCHRPIDGSAGSVRASTGEDPLCVAGAPFSVLDYDSARRSRPTS
jgi:hypothetical protein